MSPPLLGVEGGGQNGNNPLTPSPTHVESGLKDHNCFGLSDCSSVDSSNVSTLSEENKDFKATELRLGLPGSQSPERDSKLDEKPLFPLTPLKNGVSGSKRGFSDTETGTQGKILTEDFTSPMMSSRLGAPQAPPVNGAPKAPSKGLGNTAPVAKAQVVGWPPIRNFRKNTLATTSKNNDPLFVKVSMDGAPYLRKVDLRTYVTYQELSSGLEKMFSCFTLGQCGSNMSENNLRDLLHGSEYVLTYEDKDGDWMLVGDVPWEMFIDSCKRLKIMKGSDAIGLAPRAMEKSKSQN